MIITTDSDVVIKGNVGANSVAMTIDPEAMEHIMSVLTNMYSNNHRAVAREYVANALDSHTEAGQTRPIEVISPSEWEPRLIIRDYGIGLSADEILNVYGVYGRSTRRADNTAIGGLGLGSKSGFTLSGQFVVTGIKNGRKTVALFSLGHNGAPTMEVLTEKDTDECNGVTVSIAVDDVSKMRRAIEDLSRTWPKDRVLVDGHPPRFNIYDTATHIGNDIYLVDSQWGLTVDMGGVAYSVPRSITDELGKVDALTVPGQVWLRMKDGHFGVLARMPIGSVAIAPNRETLRNTPQTLAAIQKIFDSVGEHYSVELQKICDKAANGIQANLLLRGHQSVLGQNFMRTLNWSGHKLESLYLEFPRVTLQYNRGKKVAHESGQAFRVDSLMSEESYRNMLFITGVKPDDTSKVRRLASRYLDNSSNHHTSIVIVPEATGSVKWFSWGDNEYITTMTLDEFREAARKLPSRSERNETRYSNYTLRERNGQRYWDRNYIATAADISDSANAEIYFGSNIWAYPVNAFQVGDMLVDINRQQKRPNLEKRIGQTLVNASDVADKYAAKIVATATKMDTIVIGNGVDHSAIIKVQKSLADLGYTNPVLDSLVKQADEVKAHSMNMTADRRAELESVRHQLPAVDDWITSGYHEWANSYYLVRNELVHRIQWSYSKWKPEYAKHMVEYMKMIDSKEDKNV